MNIIDIIAGVLLLYALWRGWMSGILVQISGIAGVILGAWLAFRFSGTVCRWFSLDTDYKWLAFVAILIVAMIAVIVVCKLLTKMLESGGLSLPVKMLGAVASSLKMVIIMALLIRTFENINRKTDITDNQYLQQSYAYEPVNRVADLIFPYLNRLYDSVESETTKLTPEIQKAIDEEVDKQLKEKLTIDSLLN